MEVQLSVLIPSIPERIPDLQRVIEELNRQGQGKPVEILAMIDNRKRTIGAKRNALVEQAQGRYVVFVDDDDRVSPDYIEALCDRIVTDPDVDCIVFAVAVYSNGAYVKDCLYDRDYKHGQDANYYYRKPNCRVCYKREIALKHKFLDISFGEDDEWGARASTDIQKQAKIPAVLYHYDYVAKPGDWYTKG